MQQDNSCRITIVNARWTAHPDNARHVSYYIQSDDGVGTVQVNQQAAGARWILLGTYGFSQGSDYQISITDEADGYVIADGIRLVPIVSN